jgi:predicted nucleic acid-binding protein
MVESHPMHDVSVPWLRRGRAGEFGFLVASHTVAELYAVLTTLPIRPRISPESASRLIGENLGGNAKTISLSAADYRQTVDRMAAMGLTGGVIYDALIARAAQKSRAERLLTLDLADFERVWPEGRHLLRTP